MTAAPRVPNFTKSDGVSLKEHVESRLNAEHQYFETKIAAVERALSESAVVLNRRLAGMNEFRDAMSDLSNRMATRNEMDVHLKQVAAELADLKKSRDMASGKASQTALLITLAFSLLGVAISVINML